MESICSHSRNEFSVSDHDKRFYEKLSPSFGGKKQLIPFPSLSPLERLRRRQAWRNERHLFHSTCDLCKRSIISSYSPATSFPVYCPECWWSDRWDPYSFGRDYDVSRAFFPQFYELMKVVPRISLIHLGDIENSAYTHDVLRLKDCYLVFDGEQSRASCYGETFFKIEDCYDFLDLHHSSLCYECIACEHCYNLKYCHSCFQCSDSWFLRDCRGCKNCFGCANLHQKEYFLFNEPCSKHDYQQFLQSFQSSDPETLRQMQERALTFWTEQLVRFMRGIQNENVTGDYVSFSKDSVCCFNSRNLRDCKFCTNIALGANDCYDIDVWGGGIELCYECSCIGEQVRDSIGCLYVLQGAERVYYSQFCSRKVSNLFGCIGLRKADFVILNKRYAPDEFEKLVSRIIGQMKEAKEWGEFFPIELSPFPYNHTVAHEFFPLSREEASQSGFKWDDAREARATLQDGEILARDFHGSLEDALHVVFCCEESGKAYRLQRSELEFYKKMKLPLPRFHPDIRHANRMRIRNPRKLFSRPCDSCHAQMETTYPDGSRPKVFCEACYQKHVVR